MPEAVPHARHFYDRISGVYDALSDSSEHAAREEGLKLLNVQPGERVLEIGFGTGHTLVTLAEAVGESGKVCGIDISQGMFDVAQKRLTEAQLGDKVEICVGEVPPLPHESESFDAVTLSFTLELFPLETIPAVLAEIKRVLVPGGRIGSVNMAVVPPDENASLLEKTYQWMHHHFPHIVDCQPIDSPASFREAGLEISARTDLKMWTMPVVAVVGRKTN